MPLSLLAQTSEEEREAEMFGAEDSRDEEIFDQESEATPPELTQTTSTEEVLLRLTEEDDKLAIGGLVFSRLNYSMLDKGDLEEFPLTAPNLVDLYLDARLSENVRFYTQGRLSFDPTATSKVSTKLDQLWLKFDLQRLVYLTLGKQRIKWGTGRFWNPTDFLNQETLDPLSVTTFDERLGVSLLKIHVPAEALGANFYALATIDDASKPEDVGGALRAELMLGTSEVSASFAARRNNPWRFGADFNGAVGPIDLKIEAGLQHGLKTTFYRGTYNTSPLSLAEFDLSGLAPEDIPQALQDQFPSVLAARLPDAFSREDEWIPQVVVGAEYGFNYTEDDAIYVGAEYFFNDAGYADSSLYPVLTQTGQLRPFYTGRHYGAVYVALPQPGDWNDSTFTASGLGNLSDRSFIARLDYSMRLLTFLTFNTFVQGHMGESGEFNFSYSQGPLIDPSLAAQIPEEFRAQIPSEALEGIDVIGPMMSVGMGLRASF
jgi:hypothetical protein